MSCLDSGHMAGGGDTYAAKVPARRQPMTAELWDRRYSKQAYAYGRDPNDFVRGAFDSNLLPREGSALLLGEGEGRNAVFLAGVGLSCTAVDLSKAGLSKARRLADERGVRIKTVAADLADFCMGCSCWDAIISVFCHLEPPLRRQVHRAAAEALRPGGVVVIEAFTPAQCRYNSGGPPDEERLVTEEMLLEDFQTLEVVLCRQLERVVLEGSYHTGLASVIQFVACRKGESSRLLAQGRKERYERNIDAIFEEVNSEAHRDCEEEDPFLSVAQAGVHYAIQASEADGRCRYCWLPKEFCACCAVSKVSRRRSRVSDVWLSVFSLPGGAAIELEKVHFVLLCHPLEFLRSSSSGKLLPCVLGADLFVFGVGINADKLDQIINDSRTHLLLPGDGSRTFEEWLARPQEDLGHGTVRAEDRRCELILLVPDGSWEQVQALRRALDRKRTACGRPTLPCLRLQEEAVSAFHSPLIDALKQGAGQGRISTFEACALLLREAEEAWSLSPGTWKDVLRESHISWATSWAPSADSAKEVMFFAYLCALSLVVSETADMSRGFPYPPDTRPVGCRKYKRKDFANHTVSIIIPWLAEKWEHMEGTMKAILHFTPDELVDEYIWISDGNADTMLVLCFGFEGLKEKELKALSSKVRVFAFPERQGLMLAKMKGVEMATAPVIVFLEAHVIPNKHWLQHILHRVVVNPKALAMPTLDQIPQENWHLYHPMPPGHWRYENPGNVIRNDKPDPYDSPGTSGGIFAMRRDWFQQLGLFDAGMREWGGDHMELTMKVWRCGGRIEIVPCSRDLSSKVFLHLPSCDAKHFFVFSCGFSIKLNRYTYPLRPTYALWRASFVALVVVVAAVAAAAAVGVGVGVHMAF
eukprot:s1406_g5.t4